MPASSHGDAISILGWPALADPTNPLWPFPFTPQDWAQTPLAVQAYVHTLRDEVKQLKERIHVLERVITDNRSSIDLDREIERLRDR